MKIKLYLLGMLCISSLAFTQSGNVGINTETPSATLDINGNLKVRTTPTSGTLTSYTVLGINNTTKEVTNLDNTLFASASTTTNGTVTKVSATGIGSVLGLTLSNGFQKINFPAAAIGGTANFNAATDVYTVPSDGIYAVKFSFRYGNGVQLRLLSLTGGDPRIAIFNGTTLVDESIFSGANVNLLGALGVLSLIVSETDIDSVYRFNAGDQITFQSNQSGINLDLLSENIRASAVIYKISN